MTRLAALKAAAEQVKSGKWDNDDVGNEFIRLATTPDTILALVACAEALKGLAQSGSDSHPLWAWCDDGWLCTHHECQEARAALAALEEETR